MVGPALARHRTLRATIEWSYRLLSADERQLFGHLSVFVDGVGLATAQRLAPDLGLGADPGSALSRLVDASMIDAEFGGRTRYRMLDEALEPFRHAGMALRSRGCTTWAEWAAGPGRRCGRSGWIGWRRPGEDKAAGAAMVPWPVELTADIGQTMFTEREPEADALLRRELPNLRAA